MLRPIRDLLLETTAAAVSPSLAEMRDRFASRIHLAEEEAFDKLDEAVSHLPDLQVIKVELRLRAREIENRAQLEALLRELEDRLAPLLVEGTRIRLA